MDYAEGYVRVEREERKDEKQKEGWELFVPSDGVKKRNLSGKLVCLSLAP